ncbi:unnamed protein product [Mytilus coruscus]|uniref:Farnesoic acid O-methyl transferase domain-containing protein n=1 Tax=Mytilus coruscus TaxID=42192 RepID=A0A6J8B3R8_MYTCO|nr:unnamed protein product [Mytilus coruscus]
MIITVIFCAVFTTFGLGNLLDQVWIKTENSGFVNASTPNLDYTSLSLFQLYPANEQYMKFTVKACSNAFIILYNDISLFPFYNYRIIIGAGNNSIINIRQNYDLTISSFDISTPGILNCTEHRSFELNWTVSGRITLTSGSKMLMNWTDPLPISIKDVGITTGLGSVGLWIVEHSSRFTGFYCGESGAYGSMTLLSTIRKHSRIDCVSLCSVRDDCLGVNFNRKTEECQIIAAGQQVIKMVVQESPWHLYTKCLQEKMICISCLV